MRIGITIPTLALCLMAAWGCDSTGTISLEDPFVLGVEQASPQVSFDGHRMAYFEGTPDGGGLRIIDLRTGAVRTLNVRRLVPANVVDASVNYVLWCPYDTARLLVHCSTVTDTGKPVPATAQHEFGGQNMYMIWLDRDSLVRCTPSKFGPAGPDAGGAGAWLIGSSPAVDSLYEGGGDIYIPQEDKYVHSQYVELFHQSRDGRHYIGVLADGMHTKWILDGRTVDVAAGYPLFPGGWWTTYSQSWSPSGKVVLATVDRGTDINEVWLLDIGTYFERSLPALPGRRLDINTGMTVGTDLAFISDSTFAIQLGRKVNGVGHTTLWEVGLDGRVIRPLTPEQ
ncbi:MAG TPA: hypothetical protein VHI13_14515 [Candidatus Kapabacteria bacterium]|nr:hypothetical protein [Candidatus Kapabacteria bacterium]